MQEAQAKEKRSARREKERQEQISNKMEVQGERGQIASEYLRSQTVRAREMKF